MQTIRQHNSRSPPQRTADGPVSSSDNAIDALDRNPPTMSEVRDTREAHNHGGTNVVRLSKSTLSPDEDLQCGVETSRSNINGNHRETNDKLHPLCTLSAVFNIFHDNIYYTLMKQ